MSRKPYSRKLRQLKFLRRQYDLLGANAAARKAVLERKMLWLARHLIVVLGRKVIKPLLPMTVGLMLGMQVDAQSFKDPVGNPFGTQFSGDGAFAPVMVDIDNDGDLDMFVAGYENAYSAYGDVYYYENIGTAQSPQFTDARVNPFGLEQISLQSLFIEMGDLDGDGDYDILHYVDYNPGTSEMNYIWIENTRTAEQPNFTSIRSLDLQVTLPPDIALLQLADMDDDGDLDLIGGVRAYNYATSYYDNYMAYFENVGSPQSPEFAPVNRDIFDEDIFLNSLVLAPAVGDIDDDGDIDIITSLIEYSYNSYTLESEFRFHENSDAQNPQFAASTRNPFGLKQEAFIILPDFCDLDGDGDLDMMSTAYDYGDETIEFFYFENEDITSNENVSAFDLGWKLMPNPVRDVTILDLGSDTELNKGQMLEIFDQSGTLVKQIPLTARKQEISVDNLANGTYFIQSRVGGQMVQLPFIIAR